MTPSRDAIWRCSEAIIASSAVGGGGGGGCWAGLPPPFPPPGAGAVVRLPLIGVRGLFRLRARKERSQRRAYCRKDHGVL